MNKDTYGTHDTQMRETQKTNPITDALHNIKDQAVAAVSNITGTTTTSWSQGGQPFPNARGTMMGKANYDNQMAKDDAMKLRRAMKGLGTDKATIVDITGHRTFDQRQMIIRAYINIDGNEIRDLIHDLKVEVGGDLERLVVPLYMMPGEFDAFLMDKAMRGIGKDVELLNEVLCTRTNKQIQDMKSAWTAKIDSRQKLIDRVSDETKKFFGTTHYHNLCMKLLEANRPTGSADEKLVRADAEELNRLLLEHSNIPNIESKFVQIFTERSWAHIRALVGIFQTVSKKWTLDGAICHEFGESSNTVKALRVLMEFCTDPYDFWAKRLRDALKGIGTDDSKLIRIIVSRCEIDLCNIIQVFGQRYGEGKNLKNWIEQDTTGFYCQLLLFICGFND